MSFKKAGMPSSRAMKPVLEVLEGKSHASPPIWLMRQAGRYLPEYRAIRSQAQTFLDLCFTPKLAAEVTLQPIRRFRFDAAILFSDILVVPHALGQNVSFESGEGPRLDPIADVRGLDILRNTVDQNALAPIYETIDWVKRELPAGVALLGFCGAPWTVATYMIAGRGTDDQRPARLFAYGDPEAFARLIDILVAAPASTPCRFSTHGPAFCRRKNSTAGALIRCDGSSSRCGAKYRMRRSSAFHAAPGLR